MLKITFSYQWLPDFTIGQPESGATFLVAWYFTTPQVQVNAYPIPVHPVSYAVYAKWCTSHPRCHTQMGIPFVYGPYVYWEMVVHQHRTNGIWSSRVWLNPLNDINLGKSEFYQVVWLNEWSKILIFQHYYVSSIVLSLNRCCSYYLNCALSLSSGGFRFLGRAETGWRTNFSRKSA